MQQYFGIAVLGIFILIVLTRSLILQRQKIAAVEFGKKDKSDYALLPFAGFYLYLIVAHGFNLPTIPNQVLFESQTGGKIGMVLCLSALAFFVWTMVSFKKSFRIGLTANTLQGLVTSGAFAISRNPIYVSFGLLLLGQFLLFPSWILLLYIALGARTFHRQVLKEELFLTPQYGKAFTDYCKTVRRYL